MIGYIGGTANGFTCRVSVRRPALCEDGNLQDRYSPVQLGPIYCAADRWMSLEATRETDPPKDDAFTGGASVTLTGCDAVPSQRRQG